MFIIEGCKSKHGIYQMIKLRAVDFYLHFFKSIQTYIAVLTFLLSGNAFSKTIEVTAEYKPKSYDISDSLFKSTTKCEKLTGWMWLANCNGNISPLDNLLFSIDTDVKRSTVVEFSDPKDSFFFLGFPREKNIVLVSGDGVSFSASFVPQMMGEYYNANIKPDIGWPFYNNVLSNPIGGCSHIEKHIGGGDFLGYWMTLWKGEAGNKCYTKSSLLSDGTIKGFFFGFKIKPPSPIGMPNGTYKGSITISLGKDGDLSFGNGTYTDNQLVINLTLVVRHQLKVVFPMNEKTVDLQPVRGWNNWIYRKNGHAPDALTATLAARIWASAPYNVRLRCQYLNNEGSRCLIKNERANHSVPVDVYATGMHGNQYLTYPNKDENYFGHSILSGDERPFKFEIKGAQVSEMMKHPGGRYKGDITIIIEAAI